MGKKGTKYCFSFSLHSEEKAKLLRSVDTKILSHDSELSEFLQSLQLDEIPNAKDHISLPADLIECVAELSSGSSQDKDVAKAMSESMRKVASVTADVEASIQDLKDMLKVIS